MSSNPLIVATGPLTSPNLSEAVAALVGRDQLYFYDAISPIVLAEDDRPGRRLPSLPLGGDIHRQRGQTTLRVPSVAVIT